MFSKNVFFEAMDSIRLAKINIFWQVTSVLMRTVTLSTLACFLLTSLATLAAYHARTLHTAPTNCDIERSSNLVKLISLFEG